MTEVRLCYELDSDEKLIEEPDELLFRQIHPSWLDQGQPSSQAFKPTPKDQNMLSTRREFVGAEAAYRDHLAAGLQTVGTWAVSAGEVDDAGIRAVDDSAKPNTRWDTLIWTTGA